MFWHNVEMIKASWTDEIPISFSKTWKGFDDFIWKCIIIFNDYHSLENFLRFILSPVLFTWESDFVLILFLIKFDGMYSSLHVKSFCMPFFTYHYSLWILNMNTMLIYWFLCSFNIFVIYLQHITLDTL